MSDPMRQQSPLVERITDERRSESVTEPGVTLRERPFLGYINLRGDHGDEAFGKAVRGVIDLDLPAQPNTFVENERFAAIWLGPNEWYVVARPGEESATVEALEQALTGQHCAINDLSSGLTTINLSGARVRDLLYKGCTLDLHPRSFGEGRCAQTLVAKAGAVLVYRGEQPSIDLIVRRSFADYLFLWIEDAAHEYGLAVA